MYGRTCVAGLEDVELDPQVTIETTEQIASGRVRQRRCRGCPTKAGREIPSDPGAANRLSPGRRTLKTRPEMCRAAIGIEGGAPEAVRIVSDTRCTSNVVSPLRIAPARHGWL